MNVLRSLHEQAEAGWMPYGPSDGAVEVVDTFGAYELEYGAIRKSVGVLDMPQRGLIELRGTDRLSVLHGLVTHDMKSLAPGEARRAFWLTRQGRIAADLIVIHEKTRTLLDLDIFQSAFIAQELDKLIFTEDAQVRDISGEIHHLALHGPGGAAALSQLADAAISELQTWQSAVLTLADVPVTAYRRDDAGSAGHHLLLPETEAVKVYSHLLDVLGYDPRDEQDAEVVARRRGRPVGWMAYNTARIEAGTPIYHIDFGSDSLPHETGILPETVSFTKGCYVGQEVVARMQNLGHPKRVLVGLRFADDRMPVAGTPVRDEAGEKTLGAVTSSTISPMLGHVAIALAVVKWGSHEAGTKLSVPAEGTNVPATVQGLRFL